MDVSRLGFSSCIGNIYICTTGSWHLTLRCLVLITSIFGRNNIEKLPGLSSLLILLGVKVFSGMSKVIITLGFLLKLLNFAFLELYFDIMLRPASRKVSILDYFLLKIGFVSLYIQKAQQFIYYFNLYYHRDIPALSFDIV